MALFLPNRVLTQVKCWMSFNHLSTTNLEVIDRRSFMQSFLIQLQQSSHNLLLEWLMHLYSKFETSRIKNIVKQAKPFAKKLKILQNACMENTYSPGRPNQSQSSIEYNPLNATFHFDFEQLETISPTLSLITKFNW